ncbi:Phospholipase/carboxylesterase/thioesterase [Mortierella sp. GBAus27b]|nr:Phospholipase/carboxylesterase/thioesterase [Mortierella sp. GBAus27b]
MASSTRSLTSVIQRTASRHTATMVFLHGLGDSGAGWQKLRHYLPHVKFIFPNAPVQAVSLNTGMKMPSWYDIYSLDDIDLNEDEKGMLETRQKVMEIVREEVEVNNIPANRIVIGGFSQGCVISMLTGLTAEYKFAGILALSGYMPLHKKIMSMASDSNRKTPIFWGHGDVDQIVLYEYGKKTVELLRNNKYDVQFETYPRMAHGTCAKEIKDIVTFLTKVIPENESATAEATAEA